ncbi:MAG: hypothetical protein HYS98_06155 [Deltaproteobacteria bacterium]|nr:hypothetical protein [Deltaproteobacteria bacterium]
MRKFGLSFLALLLFATFGFAEEEDISSIITEKKLGTETTAPAKSLKTPTQNETLDHKLKIVKDKNGKDTVVTINGVKIPFPQITARAEIRTNQGAQGTADNHEPNRDNVEVRKVQLIPYFRVKNITPRLDFKVHAVLNFESRINDRIERRDGEKETDSTDNGLWLRPSKELLEAIVASLEADVNILEGRKTVIVFEAGKGKLHVGDMPNTGFFDYSALEAFNYDQTGFLGLALKVDDRFNVIFEVFNLQDQEGGAFFKSFNFFTEAWVVKDEKKTLRAYASATHAEQDFKNRNEVVDLVEDQDQYSVGAELSIKEIGRVNAQYVYRDNEDSRDDQGFGITYDKAFESFLKRILPGFFPMAKYEYLDSSNNPDNKHLVALGANYDVNELWNKIDEKDEDNSLDDDPKKEPTYLGLENWKWSWGFEVYHASRKAPFSTSRGQEDTGIKTGLKINW